MVGLAFHVGARVAAKARAGEVLVSSCSELMSQSGIRFKVSRRSPTQRRARAVAPVPESNLRKRCPAKANIGFAIGSIVRLQVRESAWRTGGRWESSAASSPRSRRLKLGSSRSGLFLRAYFAYTASDVRLWHKADILTCSPCPLLGGLCCKTRMYLPTRCRLYFCRALFRCPDEGVAASTHRYQRLTHQLCWTGRRQWRWTAKKLDEPPQVLRGCCEQDLVPRTGQASQSKPVEPEDTLHMRKSHLDLLALAV